MRIRDSVAFLACAKVVGGARTVFVVPGIDGLLVGGLRCATVSLVMVKDSEAYRRCDGPPRVPGVDRLLPGGHR